MNIRSKRHTIVQVAKVAGVSKQTVFRVINDRPDVALETRKRIQQVNHLKATAAISFRNGLGLYRQRSDSPGRIAACLPAGPAHLVGLGRGLLYNYGD